MGGKYATAFDRIASAAARSVPATTLARLSAAALVRPSSPCLAAVYAGAPAKPPAELIQNALARLDLLEARLGDERIDELVVYRPLPGELLVDGVPRSQIVHDREALRALIEKARAHYKALAEEPR